jgi:hypothetical protein
MEAAIAALLTQRSVDDAARAVGIYGRTMLRWMKDPVFQTEYRAARRQVYFQSVARLQQGTSLAAATLLKVMLDPNSPASVRVRAAECVMDQSSKGMEIEDVEARVAALEAATGGPDEQ